MKKNMIQLLLFASLGLGSYACSSNTATPNTDNSNKILGIPEIDAITNKIISNPSDTALRYARIRTALRLEEFPLALSDAEFLVRFDSTRVENFRLLADVYYQSKQINPCMDVLELTAKKFPKDIYTKLSLAQMQLVLSEHDKSLILLDEVAKLNPYSVDAMYLRGLVHKDQEDTLKALAAFQEVVQQDAQHFEAYIQLGELNTGMKNPLALQYLDNALRIDSSNVLALRKKAFYYHWTGQFKPALEWYEKATVAAPLNPDVAYNKGLLLLDEAERTNDKKLWDNSYQSFKIATQNDPQFGEAYFYRGFCAEKLGDKAAAKNDYDNAVAMCRQDSPELEMAREALKKLQ